MNRKPIIMVESTKLWVCLLETLVFSAILDGLFYFLMHGKLHWALLAALGFGNVLFGVVRIFSGFKTVVTEDSISYYVYNIRRNWVLTQTVALEDFNKVKLLSLIGKDSSFYFELFYDYYKVDSVRVTFSFEKWMEVMKLLESRNIAFELNENHGSNYRIKNEFIRFMIKNNR